MLFPDTGFPELEENGVNKVYVHVCESKEAVIASDCEFCGATEATPHTSWTTIVCGSEGIEGWDFHIGIQFLYTIFQL